MAKNQSKGLGKGLSTLISSKNFDISNIVDNNTSDSSSIQKVINIELDKISLNPFQPRKTFDPVELNELVKSIEQVGIINPITVREIIGGYEIVAGERRFRAFQIANKKTIPALITSIVSEVEQHEKALIENIQRKDLNVIEIAISYQKLMNNFNYTQEQLAERLGKERASIANTLRLLKLPDTVKQLILEEKISFGHAKVLLSLENEINIINAANEVIVKGLSVRATETLVRSLLTDRVKFSTDGKKKTKNSIPNAKPTEEQIIIEDIQNRLRTIYGTSIKIFPKTEKKGTIEFEFYSNEDFERIIELLERKEIVQ